MKQPTPFAGTPMRARRSPPQSAGVVPAEPVEANACPRPAHLPLPHILPIGKSPGIPTPALPRQYTRPRYAENFHCLPSACEDTCCQGWSVPIDQATWEKYQSNPVLKPLLNTLITRNTSKPTASDFARISQTSAGACPMLDPQHLCSLHTQYGPEILPITCATYPRAVSTYSGQIEAVLHLSCPEAARVTLLDPNVLSSEFPDQVAAAAHPAILSSSAAINPSRYTSVASTSTKPGRLYDSRLATREFILLLLADRSYPIWQRLYLTGILARRLDVARGDATTVGWVTANPDTVARLLSDSARMLVLGRLRPAMDGILPKPDQQLQLLTELLRLRLASPGVLPPFIECVRDFERGIGCATATSEAQVLAAYADAHNRWYLPLMERYPHILENYLANYVFKNHHPFGRPRHTPLPDGQTPDALTEHLQLCAHLALAQMLLIGIAGCKGKAFAVEHVLRLMQSLARTIEHSPHFLDQIPAFLRQKNLINLRSIPLLLQAS